MVRGSLSGSSLDTAVAMAIISRCTSCHGNEVELFIRTADNQMGMLAPINCTAVSVTMNLLCQVGGD